MIGGWFNVEEDTSTILILTYVQGEAKNGDGTRLFDKNEEESTN